MIKNNAGIPMEHPNLDITKLARQETLPDIPRKIRWKARFFGKQVISDYLWNYYERESEMRVPFYLPYIYVKENFDYLRRYGRIPRNQISLVLIDGNDERIDYFLFEFLQELNFLTIVTDRKEYFEGLQERAFQELGLIIDLIRPWEEKNLCGNLVWDFTENLQRSDCYPDGSICFMPHKKEWKIRETLKSCGKITAAVVKNVETNGECIFPDLAETLLVPRNFPFRKSRCEELQKWCKKQKWNVKMRAWSLEKP